jgi:hypothetical protein
VLQQILSVDLTQTLTQPLPLIPSQDPSSEGWKEQEREQEQDRRYRSPDRWLPAAAVLVPTKELAR